MSFQIELSNSEEFNKMSAADFVECKLRRQIISGEIPLGQRLVERDLASKFNVSITPVRHAIMTLSEEGLINIYPYKGNYVTDLTEELVKNILDSRELLELHAAKDSYFNMVKNDKNCLLSIINNAESRLKSPDDAYGATILDINFHTTIVGASSNKVLLDMWKAVGPRTMLMQCYSKRYFGFSIEKFKQNHIGMATALSEEKGTDAFIEEMKKDLERSRELHNKMVSLMAEGK